MNETRELKIEDLRSVTGGRGMNQEEYLSQFEIDKQYYDLKDYYYTHRREKEWKRVEQEIHDAAGRWYQTIANAPEDHPTIPFSDFFDFEAHKN